MPTIEGLRGRKAVILIHEQSVSLCPVGFQQALGSRDQFVFSLDSVYFKYELRFPHQLL